MRCLSLVLKLALFAASRAQLDSIALAQSFGNAFGKSPTLGVVVSPLTSNSIELGIEARISSHLTVGAGYNPGVWRAWDKNKYERSGFGWNFHGKYFPWGQSVFLGGRLTGNQIRYEGNIAAARGAPALRHTEYDYDMHAHLSVGWQKIWANGFSLGSEIGGGPRLLTVRRSFDSPISGSARVNAVSLIESTSAKSGTQKLKEALDAHASHYNLYVNLLSFGYMF